MRLIRVIAPSSRAPALLLLPLVIAISGCGPRQISVTQSGHFSGSIMSVVNQHGDIYAYAPAIGEPADKYTVTQASASKGAQTAVKIDRLQLTVCPKPTGVHHLAEVCSAGLAPSVDYTVRIPKQARASLFTNNGAIHATDVAGPVDARVHTGDIKIQIPSYADAAAQDGNITVMFGDAQWPGTLHFSTERGDVELWVPATADADVALHTDHGTIFTDFNLRGTSNGNAETIVGSIGRGGNRKVDVHVTNGSIRMLKLTPQM